MAVECKYSADPTHVGRGGYEQVLPYMAEQRTALAPTVASVVIGSLETVVPSGSTKRWWVEPRSRIPE